MPHHFTKATVEASIFCNTCMKGTRWKVADGRRQYCIECFERKQQQAKEKQQQAKEQKPETPAAEQGRLF